MLLRTALAIIPAHSVGEARTMAASVLLSLIPCAHKVTTCLHSEGCTSDGWTLNAEHPITGLAAADDSLHQPVWLAVICDKSELQEEALRLLGTASHVCCNCDVQLSWFLQLHYDLLHQLSRCLVAMSMLPTSVSWPLMMQQHV